MKVFAGFKNEVWCMDKEYVDKLAKANNGAKYFMVLQKLCHRTVVALGVKTEHFKKTFHEFLTMISKKKRPKENWANK